MAAQDRIKWNRKFTDKPELTQPRPPSAMVAEYYRKAPGNIALDLACGGGRHTLFLSEKGFYVDAVDISDVALQKLAGRIDPNQVRLIEADLDEFVPEPGRYDLIVITNYLDRDLIRRTQKALHSGGLMIVETYMQDSENEKEDANPAYLLQRGELPTLFGEDFEIMAYREFWNEAYELYRMKKAAIAVRKK